MREGATVSDGFLVSAEVGFCELLGWGDGSIEGETLTDGTVLGCDVSLGLNLVGDDVIELGTLVSGIVGVWELLGWGDGTIDGETVGTVLGCDVRLGLNLVGDNVIELGRILGTEDGGDVGVPEGAEELSPPFSITTIDKKL